MSLPRPDARPRRWTVALGAGLALLLFGAEALRAQAPGPPPPSLHDRALPPVKPFDHGGFERPGHSARTPTVLPVAAIRAATEAAVRIDAQLRAGDPAAGPDARAAASGLVRALRTLREDPRGLPLVVDLYNALVLSGPEALLRNTPADVRAVQSALLDIDGVGLASIGWEPETETGCDQPSGAQALRASFAVGEPCDAPALDDDREREARALALLREWHRIELCEPRFPPAPSRWTAPGMAASNPHGFGAGFGQVWVGVSYQPRARRASGQTGAAALGFGVGDPGRWVGLQVAVSSFSTVSSGFWNRSALDLHLHRVLPGNVGVAVGWESAVVWGSQDTRKDSGSNRYAVASRWFSLRDDPDGALGAAMVSLGVGDGRFRSERAFLEGRGGVGLFGSAAVRVAQPLSLIAEWTGQDLMLATSMTPLAGRRLAVTAGLTDVTGSAGDGARFVVGVSAARDFR